MICPVCKERYAPRRVDHWRNGDIDAGEPLLVPAVPDAQDQLNKMFDDDYVTPCPWCVIR